MSAKFNAGCVKVCVPYHKKVKAKAEAGSDEKEEVKELEKEEGEEEVEFEKKGIRTKDILGKSDFIPMISSRCDNTVEIRLVELEYM